MISYSMDILTVLSCFIQEHGRFLHLWVIHALAVKLFSSYKAFTFFVNVILKNVI